MADSGAIRIGLTADTSKVGDQFRKIDRLLRSIRAPESVYDWWSPHGWQLVHNPNFLAVDLASDGSDQSVGVAARRTDQGHIVIDNIFSIGAHFDHLHGVQNDTYLREAASWFGVDLDGFYPYEPTVAEQLYRAAHPLDERLARLDALVIAFRDRALFDPSDAHFDQLERATRLRERLQERYRRSMSPSIYPPEITRRRDARLRVNVEAVAEGVRDFAQANIPPIVDAVTHMWDGMKAGASAAFDQLSKILIGPPSPAAVYHKVSPRTIYRRDRARAVPIAPTPVPIYRREEAWIREFL